MGPIEAIRRLIISSIRSAQLGEEIRDGIANLTDVLDRRMAALIAGQNNQTQLVNQRLRELVLAIDNKQVGGGGTMPAEGLHSVREIKAGIANENNVLRDKPETIASTATDI